MKTGRNIYKRKDGRWEARYHKGRDASGKLVYGFCYGKTYLEAKEKAEQAIHTATPTLPQNNIPSISVGELCDKWLQINKLRLKESTYIKYQSIIEKHLKPYFGILPVQEMNTELVSQFSNRLLYENGLAPKTVKDILLLLHSVSVFATRLQPEKTAPIEIIYPKVRQTEIRVLNRTEQELLTNCLLADVDACKLGMLLAMWTGMRLGEVCALRWTQISLAEECIYVNATMQRIKNTLPGSSAKTKILIDSPKSTSSLRIIPLSSKAVSLCKSVKPINENAYLLTGTEKYMEPRILQRHFKSIANQCGLKDVHFHTLRHTFATRCVEADFEIKSLSEILGHANTAITLNRYVHCSIALKRANMKKLKI